MCSSDLVECGHSGRDVNIKALIEDIIQKGPSDSLEHKERYEEEILQQEFMFEGREQKKIQRDPDLLQIIDRLITQ
mgnify:FL=1